jgi:hypothetical protein
LKPGKKWDLSILRTLTWANRERGTDSLGFFDSTGKMTKRACDPSDALRKKGIKKWLKVSQERSWFIAGHTRFATRGSVNRRNAHPFRYGRIIGSHNGIIDAPSRFKVDSEYLFWCLNKAHGAYQKGLQDIAGYFGVSWFDGENFYLLCHSGELAYEIIDGILYYSSSWSHLDSCTGGDSKVFKEGQVLRISSDGTVANSREKNSPIKQFVSQAPDYWGGYGTYACYGGMGGTTTRTRVRRSYQPPTGGSWDAEREGGFDEARTARVREYDNEWQEAWATYCAENSDDGGTHNHGGIHALSEDEFNSQYAG